MFLFRERLLLYYANDSVNKYALTGRIMTVFPKTVFTFNA